MPRDHRERAALPHDGDGLLADRHVVAEDRVLLAHDPLVEVGLVEQRLTAPVRCGGPTTSSKNTIWPVVGRTCATRQPALEATRHPQDEVAEGQVRDQLPVTDEQLQPLDLGGREVGGGLEHLVEGGHAGSLIGDAAAPQASPSTLTRSPTEMVPGCSTVA